MNSGVPPKYESPSGDSLAVSRRSAPRPGRMTLRVGLLLARIPIHPPLCEQRSGRHRNRGLGICCQLLGAGRLDRHQHRPDNDVRRLGFVPRHVGDRRTARTRADPRRRPGRDRSQERPHHRLHQRRIASTKRLGRDPARGSELLARRLQRQRIAAAVLWERNPQRRRQS